MKESTLTRFRVLNQFSGCSYIAVLPLLSTSCGCYFIRCVSYLTNCRFFASVSSVSYSSRCESFNRSVTSQWFDQLWELLAMNCLFLQLMVLFCECFYLNLPVIRVTIWLLGFLLFDQLWVSQSISCQPITPSFRSHLFDQSQANYSISREHLILISCELINPSVWSQ